MLQQLFRQFAAPATNTTSTWLRCHYFHLNASLQSSAPLDYSRYPKLNENELEESFTRGSGPGGQSVNKTSNCVLLRHLPTNIIVKCHTHRILSKNRTEARKLLLEKLDAHLNGEHSIAAQLKTVELKKSTERKRRQQKMYDMKKSWKERERNASEAEKGE